jgi:endonuclease-3 related protein
MATTLGSRGARRRGRARHAVADPGPPFTPPPLLPRPDPLRARLLRIYERLARRYGPQGWWPARSRAEVVIGAILTQNAAWRNVERAIERLRAAGALDLAVLRALPPARLAALVRPSGTFRVKAARLRAFAGHVARRHGGRLERLLRLPLPALRAELRQVPGIGAETADAIALYAAGRPVFVVDAYTRRILARHRLVAPDAEYTAVQTLFMAHLPHDPALFNEYHALLVRVAKEHCRARPLCQGCPLRFDLRGLPPREVGPALAAAGQGPDADPGRPGAPAGARLTRWMPRRTAPIASARRGVTGSSSRSQPPRRPKSGVQNV